MGLACTTGVFGQARSTRQAIAKRETRTWSARRETPVFSMFLASSSNRSSGDRKHWLVNLYHVLQLESFFNKVRDTFVYCGSIPNIARTASQLIITQHNWNFVDWIIIISQRNYTVTQSSGKKKGICYTSQLKHQFWLDKNASRVMHQNIVTPQGEQNSLTPYRTGWRENWTGFLNFV